jgi:ABC-type branched-subunit amino acid transport system substrate-binding protein
MLLKQMMSLTTPNFFGKLLVGAVLLTLSACSSTESVTRTVDGWFTSSPPAAPASSTPGTAVNVPPPSDPSAPQPVYSGSGYVAPGTPILAPADPSAAAAAAPQVAPVAPVPVPGRAIKVALLLPLSGDQAAFGKNLMNGAELATVELGRESFELMPRDSGTTPQQAAKAASDAIAAGAQLIIGPLFSSSVEAVKPVANAMRVPVIALSNDWNNAGNGVYVLGFSPAEQVARVAGYAASKGMTELGVLAPSSPYGDLVVNTAKQMNSVNAAVVVARYSNNPASIGKAVSEIVAAKSSIKGLLVPEGGATLHAVTAQLSPKGLSARQMPLLGTGLWDEEKTSSDFALIGGLYAAPDPASRASFVQRYERSYGTKPQRLASLAYDATALAVALVAKNAAAPFSDAAITNPNGFAGIDGIFRVLPNGTTQRGLAVMEVTKSGPKIIDPAPKHF